MRYQGVFTSMYVIFECWRGTGLRRQPPNLGSGWI